MKVQKLIFVFTLTLIITTLTAMMTPIKKSELVVHKCQVIMELNNTMNKKLTLTTKQLKVISNSNKNYCLSRKSILDKPTMTGQNTALLLCWDQWRLELKNQLTPSQMEIFMQWQSQVDLLGNAPF